MLGAAVAALIFFTAGPVASQQDTLQVAPIKPVPELQNHTGRGIIHENEPGENFNGQGPIQRVEAGSIVIGDTLWKVSPLATYFKKSTGFPALRDEFVPGAWVGYYLDENRVITSLWLFSNPPE